MSESKPTGVQVNGTVRVTIQLHGEYNYRGSISSEIPWNFGGNVKDFPAELDRQVESLKERILIATGQKGIVE